MEINDLIECTTAGEYLEAMRPYRWVDVGRKWVVNWFFRGIGNADYPLIPSAWRWKDNSEYRYRLPKTMMNRIRGEIREHIKVFNDQLEEKGLKGFDGFTTHHLEDVITQASAEHLMMIDFRYMLNRFGLSSGIYFSQEDRLFAFVSQYLHDLLVLVNSGNIDNRWTGTSLALAQHHGIPTRLIDWTTDPMVACFFSANGVSKSAKKIAVLCVRKFEFYQDTPIRVLEVPFELSAYIKSQSGLFTVDTSADVHFLQTGKFPTMDTWINQITKITLPTSEVPELNRLLWLDNKSLASMMPTIDNIVGALSSKWDAEY